MILLYSIVFLVFLVCYNLVKVHRSPCFCSLMFSTTWLNCNAILRTSYFQSRCLISWKTAQSRYLNLPPRLPSTLLKVTLLTLRLPYQTLVLNTYPYFHSYYVSRYSSVLHKLHLCSTDKACLIPGFQRQRRADRSFITREDTRQGRKERGDREVRASTSWGENGNWRYAIGKLVSSLMPCAVPLQNFITLNYPIQRCIPTFQHLIHRNKFRISSIDQNFWTL